MKRLALIAGVVITVAATPTVVAASGSGQSSNADRYKLAHSVNSPVGELYGPVKVAPSSYAFITK
jgi:hypothetical protein